MRSRAVVGVFIAVVAVVAVATPGLVLGQSSGASQTQPTATTTNTTIAIHPHPNGDARVLVFTTFTLNDSNETAAFRALAREFENGNTGFSIGAFRRAANQSSIVTGRSMNITNVTRNATIEGENTTRTDIGKLALGFTWTNFARTSSGTLLVGDVFNTTHGTWLPGLTENQVLVIESPRGYAITRSPVGFSNGTLRWEGPTKFEPGTPSVAFERRAGADRPPNRDGDNPEPSAPTPLFAFGAGVVVLCVVVAGTYVLRRREETDERGDGKVTAAQPAEHTEDAPPADPPNEEEKDELLSDEERVERLLERNDGRMKQATIVTETGWSNAKVSQLLSAMDEEGRIDKLRIGRENLISLPEK
ncbi:MAG TPA: hypothetical protein VFJ06_02045 [Halococcus sp.]|nr:hypothetical protein [Halococcus sp.]